MIDVERLARALYEAYWFRWYGGAVKDTGRAPEWVNSNAQDVWRARAMDIAAEVGG